jgi:hypothetical protein
MELCPNSEGLAPRILRIQRRKVPGMFKSETLKCLERALTNLAAKDSSAVNAAGCGLTAGGVGQLAKRLADQLWMDGYELDPINRAGPLRLSPEEEPLYG